MNDHNPATFPASRENSPWLRRYRDSIVAGSLVLDLGCGNGDDTRELVEYGCEAVALDLERARVQRARPLSALIVGDMSQGLPFRDNRFDLVVSSLSMHYFDAASTRRVVAEVARMLRPSGTLLCRVNAVGDTNFGYGEGVEVEPDLYRLPDGRHKRFFSADTLERFLAPCFTVETITPRTILQHDLEKRTLECLARKR